MKEFAHPDQHQKTEADLNSALTSTLVNDFRYNFNDFRNAILPATPGVPEIRVINPDQNWKSGANYITPQITTQNRNQVRDDITWGKGAHSLRFDLLFQPVDPIPDAAPIRLEFSFTGSPAADATRQPGKGRILADHQARKQVF